MGGGGSTGLGIIPKKTVFLLLPWGFGLLAEETIKSNEFWAQGATSQILEEISFQE